MIDPVFSPSGDDDADGDADWRWEHGDLQKAAERN